jgi:hypothetical protein
MRAHQQLLTNTCVCSHTAQERPPWQGPQDSGRYKLRPASTTTPVSGQPSAAGRLPGRTGAPAGCAGQSPGSVGRLRDQGAVTNKQARAKDVSSNSKDTDAAALAAWKARTAKEALAAALQQVAIAGPQPAADDADEKDTVAVA